MVPLILIGGGERAAKCVAEKPAQKVKIGYFADGPWAHEAFKRLIADKDIEIRFICLRYDSEDNTLRKFGEQYNIQCIRHKNINSSEFIESVKSFECDLFVSMSFNQIFRCEIINMPPLKTINCHAGKLPFYRGRNILNWALINDEKEFGITVHYVDEGIDTGDIILQRVFPITDNDDYKTLLETAYKECAKILYDAIKLVQRYEITPIKQKDIHPEGFYCIQRKEGDEIINWNQSSREIFNFVRAICKPGPMARSFIEDKEIKINKANIIEKASSYRGITGSIIGIEKEGFLVKTLDSFVKITEWESERKLKIGDRFNH